MIDPRIARIAGLLGPMPEIQQTPGMGLLGPGMAPTPPAVMPAQMPMPGPMPDNRSLWQKVQDNVRAMPERLMPTPQGLGGLLSDDDAGAARKRGMLDFGLSLLANASGTNGGNAPSLGQALQSGVQQGRQSYQQGIESTLQNRMTGMQLGMQQHVLQARQAIGSYLSQHMGGTPAEQMQALRSAYQMAVAVGDMEMAKTLSPMLEKDTELGAREPQAIAAGGRTVLLDPRTHKPIGEIEHTPTPMSEEARGFRQDSADMRREAIDMRREQQEAQREARFVQQYETMSKPFAQAAINVQALNENRAGALHGDPIAQQTALQDFIKLNLPGQIVTAGELHAYAGLMGLGDKGEQLLRKLESGVPLSTQQIKLIYQHADGLVRERKKAADYLRKQMQQRARAYGVDPEAFVDHFGFLDTTPSGPAPTGAAAVDRHLNKSY